MTVDPHDTEFKDSVIEAVKRDGAGWQISTLPKSPMTDPRSKNLRYVRLQMIEPESFIWRWWTPPLVLSTLIAFLYLLSR